MGPTWGRYLSRTTILTCILLFVAGVFVGVVTYRQRSDVAEQLLSRRRATTPGRTPPKLRPTSETRS
jgi:hypothetical protein